MFLFLLELHMYLIKAKVLYNDIELEAKAGMVLGLNAILKTNGSDIELTSPRGSVFRLMGRSEFCIENTVEGVIPVVYGNVLYRKGKNEIYDMHIKYRTSCFCNETSTIIAQKIDNTSDLYYTMEEPLTIYEYNEYGQYFEIVKLKPYQQCILSFNMKNKMNDRYKVKDIKNLCTKDIVKIFENYLLPAKWEYSSGDDIKAV